MAINCNNNVRGSHGFPFLFGQLKRGLEPSFLLDKYRQIGTDISFTADRAINLNVVHVAIERMHVTRGDMTYFFYLF